MQNHFHVSALMQPNNQQWTLQTGFSKYLPDSGPVGLQNVLQAEIKVIPWFLLVLLMLRFNGFVRSLLWEKGMEIK